MNLDSTNEVLGLVSLVVAVSATLLGLWVKYALPRWKMSDATHEAILGRQEIRDRSGAVIQPAQPGMVAQVAILTETLRELLDGRFRTLEDRVDDHEGRLAALEDDAA